MQKIILNSRDGKFRFEKEFSEGNTVYDIKEYISQHIRIVHGAVDKSTISIFYNENVLKDHILLSKFNTKELSFVFEYPNIENRTTVQEESVVGEVLTNSINPKVTVRILENGCKMVVDHSEIMTKDNKVYLVRRRSQRINWNSILETLKKFKIGREDVLKVLIFSLLLFTNNGEIVFILGTIFFLRLTSGFFSKHKRDFTKKFEHFSRTAFMFVASMFMIDHARF